jgi:hypothetical protein
VIAVYGVVMIGELAPVVWLDVATDYYRVRNWWRRRRWRGVAKLLAGQSTASSYGVTDRPLALLNPR